MAYINDEKSQMHVKRIKPEISVNDAGTIIWKPGLIDYNADAFQRGKTVTNDEFNSLFLQDVYQGNYITDTLSEVFNKHLHDSVYKTFTNSFDLVPSYIKYFTQASDWGELHEDGYYYITVTAEEHGFEPKDDLQASIERMNIDTEMYVLNSDGKFYEVAQVTTAQDNTVTAYTDDNTLTGFLVIRTNDKAYALAEGYIEAVNVLGLDDVARTGDYTDLSNRPDNRIITLESYFANDPTEVEPVKIAKKANIANTSTIAQYASADTTKGTIDTRLKNVTKQATFSTVASLKSFLDTLAPSQIISISMTPNAYVSGSGHTQTIGSYGTNTTTSSYDAQTTMPILSSQTNYTFYYSFGMPYYHSYCFSCTFTSVPSSGTDVEFSTIAIYFLQNTTIDIVRKDFYSAYSASSPGTSEGVTIRQSSIKLKNYTPAWDITLTYYDKEV